MLFLVSEYRRWLSKRKGPSCVASELRSMEFQFDREVETDPQRLLAWFAHQIPQTLTTAPGVSVIDTRNGTFWANVFHASG